MLSARRNSVGSVKNEGQASVICHRALECIEKSLLCYSRAGHWGQCFLLPISGEPWCQPTVLREVPPSRRREAQEELVVTRPPSANAYVCQGARPRSAVYSRPMYRGPPVACRRVLLLLVFSLLAVLLCRRAALGLLSSLLRQPGDAKVNASIRVVHGVV